MEISYDERGLVPVITQDFYTREVLMLAYMNKTAVERTLAEKTAYYYSRKRKKLWKKGETSGHVQKVKEFSYDCDADAILLKVEQTGVACHTGRYSCFFNQVLSAEEKSPGPDILHELYDVIEERKNHPGENSYTRYLFHEGLDKILKKVGEEAGEVIISAKNDKKEELVYEISDLVYHVVVLMVEKGVRLSEVKAELERRRGGES